MATPKPISEQLDALAPALRDAVEAWMQKRKQKKNPVSERGLALNLTKLERLAPGNEAHQIDIVDSCEDKGWSGIYISRDVEEKWAEIARQNRPEVHR